MKSTLMEERMSVTAVSLTVASSGSLPNNNVHNPKVVQNQKPQSTKASDEKKTHNLCSRPRLALMLRIQVLLVPELGGGDVKC